MKYDLGKITCDSTDQSNLRPGLYSEKVLQTLSYSYNLPVVSNYIYDYETNSGIYFDNINTIVDSFVYYNNQILGVPAPTLDMYGGCHTYCHQIKFNQEIPESFSGHENMYEINIDKLLYTLPDDLKNYTVGGYIGDIQLIYKSNNVWNEVCNPPFKWVYAVEFFKSINTKPYEMYLWIISIEADFDSDGNITWSQNHCVEKVVETSNIILSTSNEVCGTTLLPMRRFEDVDQYVYGVVGFSDKYDTNAFWCLKSIAFRYDIFSNSILLGDNAYSRGNWAYCAKLSKQGDYGIYYVPSEGEFRGNCGSSSRNNQSYGAAFVVDGLQLIDKGDSDWNNRVPYYDLPNTRYEVDEVFINSNKDIFILTNNTSYDISNGSRFSRIRSRWDRSKESVSEYPYIKYDMISPRYPMYEDDETVYNIQSINSSYDLLYIEIEHEPFLLVNDPSSTDQAKMYSLISGHKAEETDLPTSTIIYHNSIDVCKTITNQDMKFDIVVNTNIGYSNVLRKLRCNLLSLRSDDKTLTSLRPNIVINCEILEEKIISY